MLIKHAPYASSVLFIFAHQDDEFGVFNQIEKEIRSGATVFCAYCTSGVKSECNSERRNTESKLVLQRLGVYISNIFFIGDLLNIPDGSALENIFKLQYWLSQWLRDHLELRCMYIPSWEGGHPDHDVVHAITVQTVQQCSSIKFSVLQYSLYNNFACVKWGFKVLTPLPMNGKVSQELIPWTSRLLHLRLCLMYVSQVKSWLGLYPFVVWHYVFKGWQSLQPISFARIHERPHPGLLYYEIRGFARGDDLLKNLSITSQH